MTRKDNRGRNLKEGESQRKDGRYMYRYTDPKTGLRQTIYDSNLASLREKEREILQKQDEGLSTLQAMKKMTVNEMFARYMQSRELSNSTRQNYQRMWNNRVASEIGQMRVAEVKASDIKLFYSKLTKQGYSFSTIKLLHNLLSPVFEMAIDDDLIRKNPTKRALRNQGVPPKEKTALTISQQNRLLHFAETSTIYKKHLPMLQVMLGIGCRCGELIGLTWADIDMKKREVYIDTQLLYKDYGDGHKFHVAAPKTEAGIRVIPMSNAVYQAFKAQREQNLMLGIPQDVEIEGRKGFVFVGRYGKPLMPSAVNNILYNLVDAYNEQETALARKEHRKAELMPQISAHTLRHTCCTRLLEKNSDLKAVQYLMGHNDISITLEVYNHITEQERIRNAVASIDAEQVG